LIGGFSGIKTITQALGFGTAQTEAGTYNVTHTFIINNDAVATECFGEAILQHQQFTSATLRFRHRLRLVEVRGDIRANNK
jgi:hypothetical protein